MNCLVEEAGLGLGEVVSYDGVISACHMNGAIVIFLDKISKVHDLVERGIIIHDIFTPIFLC